MTRPYLPDPCCVCGNDIGPHDFTRRVGEDTAHDECAEDRLHVARCCLCSQLALVDNIGNWPRHPEGRVCERCAAETDPMTALEALIAEVKRA